VTRPLSIPLARVLHATLVLLTLCSHSWAQSSLQVPIQFDFLDPGAKSLSLGSAFVGLADDATAAQANPAGLVQLTRPEISFEGRFHRLEQPFLSGGRLSGTPTGIGVDVLPGPVFVDLESTSFSPAFLSLVYPIKRVTIAAYRHEPMRLDQTFTADGTFQFRPPLQEDRDTAFDGSRSIHVTNYGASAGLRLTPGLSVGAGVSVYRFDLDFDFHRYGFQNSQLYAPPDPTAVLFRITQSGDSTGVAANVGVLAAAGPHINMGATFKRGPRLAFTSTSTLVGGTPQSVSAKFRVPDVLAVGTAIRPSDSILFTVQYNRVFDSQLRHDYIDVLVNLPGSRERADRFSIDDSNEFHLGAEYVFAGLKTTPAVRGGFWSDPDHSVRYDATPNYDFFDERISIALGSGRTLWHYTFGAGSSVSSHFEWSFGGDLSDRTRMLSFSIIGRF
jgi:long-chain fatty acid transport protein